MRYIVVFAMGPVHDTLPPAITERCDERLDCRESRGEDYLGYTNLVPIAAVMAKAIMIAEEAECKAGRCVWCGEMES